MLALSILSLILGLGLLVWSADRFVMGASATASNLGVSSLIIGLTIVGFGTSAPELFISTLSALQGNPGLAIGNAIGSNIANIALILGFTALLAPLTVRSKTLRHELPLLMAVMVLAWWLLQDKDLSRLDGILLLLALAAVMLWLVYDALRATHTGDPLEAEVDAEIPHGMAMSKAIFWLAAGLVLLMVSSQMLVWGAVNIARTLGVSDLIIGLTIVAVGTSLPELAAAVASVRKGEHDLALGNVIGSNLFNTLGVIGLPGLLYPTAIAAEAVDRDLLINLGLTVIMIGMAFGLRRRYRILRIEGAVLLACFIGYQALLYTSVIGGH